MDFINSTFLKYIILGSIFVIIILVIQLLIKRAQLKERTKFLTTFERLYTLMASTMTLNETAQELTNAIAFELGFQAGVLSVIDKSTKSLKRIAVSQTEAGIIGTKLLPVPYKSIGISLNDPNNLLIKSIREGTPQVTNSMYDLFTPALSKETVDKLQNIMGIRTSLVYPIFSKNEVIGTMIFSFSKDKKNLSALQKEAIKRIMAVVGVVLDRIFVYEQLAQTSKSLLDANSSLTRMAQEVSGMNDKLRQLDKLKDDFVSIASHELRTPMTAIRSYSWMSLYKADIPLSPKMKKYLERIYVSTDRLINLVNDMLNISRIESGRLEVTPQAFDLNQLIKDVFAEVEPKSKEKGIKLIFKEVTIPKAFADLDKVHQILLNLIGNALKFTPLKGSVTLSFFINGPVIEISVKDTGVGISAEDRSRLFQKFGRLDNSYVAAATSGGTGLGLYICKSLVELMGGKIWVLSEGIGKGTTFSFSLPIATEKVMANPNIYAKHVAASEAKALEPVAI